MSAEPKTPRRDAWHRPITREDPRRAQIIAWHLADGEQSCRSCMLSELGICSPHDPTKPISAPALYDGLNYWQAQAGFDQMLATARNQALMESAAHAEGMTQEAIEEATDRNFIAMASGLEDKTLYIELRKLRIADIAAKTKSRLDAAKLTQKDRDLSLVERRVVVLEDKMAKAKETLTALKTKGGLTAEALKQIEEAAALL